MRRSLSASAAPAHPMAAIRVEWALWAHRAALCHQGGATAPAAPHGRRTRHAARGEVSIPLQPRRFPRSRA
eukprot:14618292-Alexandrium_andersonii.AAC.1